MAKQNVLTRSKKIKADEFFRGNRLEEAGALYAEVCQCDRADADAWVMQGVIYRILGQFGKAEECCRRALAVKPDLAAAHHALGAAVQCQGRMAEAQACYRKAIQLQPAFAEAHYYLANVCKDAGDVVDAERHYQSAIARQPDYLEALGNLGALLMMQSRLEESLAVLQRALRLAPQAPQVLCNIATVLQKDDRADEARVYFQRALSYAPDFIDALAMLAELEEKAFHLDEAKSLVARGLKLEPSCLTLNVTAAKIARTEKRYEDAIALLEKVHGNGLQPGVTGGDVCINLGMLYDRVGDAERAFACFAEGNRLVMAGILPADYDRDAYLRKVERLGGFLSERLAATPCVEDDQPAPIFLVGFPRSGTTLLEQILDSHPGLQALEEKPTVDAMKRLFFELAGNNPDALADLTVSDIHKLRSAYWEEVSRHIKRDMGTLFVDKNPLNLVNAHLIWRVFPNAKFILAIRHPCDVSLSCFMQNFVLNEAMSIFSSLEESANLYEKVMSLWQCTVNLLPLDYHRIRYEDVVADFEGQARAVLDFLGVGWDDAVLKFDEHAKKRTISTPSYHQVIQPIYQHAKYRWKRYAKEFEPLMATLEPFIEYFGYSEK